MSDDTMFRLILAVLAVGLYINHHVIRRRPSSKRPRSKSRAGWIERSVGITASFWTLTLALYTTGFAWFDYALPLPTWSRWFGVAAMVACAPLSEWTYRTLGEHFSKKLELKGDHRLVDNGPYRFVRHPMYATLFLCAIATCLVSANVFVIGAVFAVAITFLLRIRKEEEMLVQRFGEEYRAYRQRTGALIPRLATMKTL